jgi:hypothetical protein
MKTLWSLRLLAGAIVAAAAFRAPDGVQAQIAPNDELSRRFIQTTTGTVKSYSAEQIVLAAEDGSEVVMELDAGARVDDSIADGQTVTIAWLVDSVGRRRVTSIAPSSPGPAPGSGASSAPPSKAYASSTEGSAMSATPAGSAASTPRPTVTGGAEYVMTPGKGFATPTPGPPPQRTPPTGSR